MPKLNITPEWFKELESTCRVIVSSLGSRIYIDPKILALQGLLEKAHLWGPLDIGHGYSMETYCITPNKITNVITAKGSTPCFRSKTYKENAAPEPYLIIKLAKGHYYVTHSPQDQLGKIPICNRCEYQLKCLAGEVHLD